MSWTAEKRDKSNELVRQWCVECGEEFETRRRMASRQRRCGRCQAKREREKARVYQQEYEERQVGGVSGRLGPREEYGFRVVVDPCEGWGRESVLGMTEIRALLRMGYLERGTVFRRLQTGEEFRVVLVDRSFRLAPVKEEVC